MRPEILAPAGSFEALTAAVRSGADAVYLGGQSLNARRSAANFDDDALRQAVELCHDHGTKLHLTLNTIVSDRELPEVCRVVEHAAKIGVDALIVQDLGVAKIVRECSDIPMHASTQMSVQTPSGVDFLSKLGFSRVVLPRELSKAEILDIRRKTDAELEMFVHGALCMCVSGQCLMSAVFGGRSGNRGLCAQPCRLPFAAEGGTGHDLSLRDLSLLPYLRELSDSGIASFKIEGRMKRPEYVAAAVTACRKALDGAENDEIFDVLRRVFSRSGHTDGYYMAKRGVSMFGTRQKEDVTAASSVLPELQKLYAEDKPLYPVTFSFTAKENAPVTLTAFSSGKEISVEGDVPQKAQNKPTDRDAVSKQLTKCGGTLFYPQSVEISLDDGIFLPASALNALRRSALEGLQKEIRETPQYTYTETKTRLPEHRAARQKTYVRFSDSTQIPSNLSVDKIILPIWCDSSEIARYSAAVEVPRGAFSLEKRILEKLLECKAAGVREAVFGTLDGLSLILKAGLSPIAGFGTNIYNSESLEVLRSLGVREAMLSAEITFSEAQNLLGTLPRGVFGYGRIPLMLSRNCPQRNGKTCAECKRTGSVTDRKGITFPIECRSGCAEILNSCPVVLSDKKHAVRDMDFMLLYFTTETPEECEKILRDYREGHSGTMPYTRGLAFRGVE